MLVILGAAGAQDQRYYLYGGGFYGPEEPVVLSTWLSGRPATDLILYRVENPGDILQLGGPDEFDLTSQLDLTEFMAREVIEVNPDRNTQIDFGVLPIGVYLAQLGTAETGTAAIVLVSDLALVTKRDADTMLIYTSDLTSGEPVDAQLHIEVDGEVTELEARPGGVTLYPTGLTEESGGLEVAANIGDAWAFSDAWWSRWSADTPVSYLVTDRPVYRPGDEVGIKGTVRLSRSMRPVAGENLTVIVEDADYEVILETTVTTDQYGSFDIDLALATAAPLGYYSVRAEVGEDTGWGSFYVEEYQVPEFAVEVTADVPYAIHGETASFTVGAEYLFGGPVGGGTVNYVVMSEPYSPFAWRSEHGFYGNFSSTFGGSVIARGESSIGPDGTVVIPVELQPQDNDYRLTLQAQVSDESDEQISGSASLIAYRADLVLGVSTERYAMALGEETVLTVTSQDLEGNPVSTDFTIQTEHSQWVEGSGIVREAGPEYTGTTDADGTATITIEPGRSGSWTITAGATDDQGRFTDSSARLWLFGGEAWYWDYDYLEVNPDKEEYQIGETARFVIQSPVADSWALITHEGDRVREWQLVQFNGNSLTYELEVSGNELPNAWLGVVIVGDGEIYQSTTSYSIDPASRFLDVTIETDADTYRPGTSTELNVLVTDADGAPVQAQLTLAVVDEGIYLIRPDHTADIRAFFYSWRGNNVSTDLSTWAYFGQIAPVGAAREAMDEAVFAQAKADAAAAAGAELEEARVREDFRDTMLWVTDIETDEEGRATLTMEFPDNLTRWRVTARAITEDGLVGQHTAGVTVTLPVIARLSMPDFLVHGDTTRIRVIGQNNLEDNLRAQWSLLADGLELDGDAEQSAQIVAGGRATRDWTAHADQVGTAEVEAQVLTGQASDGVRLPLQVVPHGLRTGMVWAEQGNSTWEFTLPDNARAGSLTGSVVLTPNFTAAVTPAVSWLYDLQYGYTELIISRLLALVQANQNGLALPEELEDLNSYVSDGLLSLYRLQHPDGGFGFWRFDTSSPLITAYVVDGLLTLREAGHDIREYELERAFDYLVGASRKDKYQVYDYLPEEEQLTASVDARAYVWLALAHGGYQTDHLHGLPGDPALSNHGLALSILALIATGDTVEANLYLDELLSRTVDRDAVAYFESEAPRFIWSDDHVHTTALALQALAQLRPDSEIVPRMVNWLLLERSGTHWYSSKATAAVVKAALSLSEPADPETEEMEPLTATVRLNRIVIAEPELGSEQVEVDLTRLAAPGRNILSIEVPEESEIYVSAGIEFFIEDEFSEPSGNGIAVTRTFELLTPQWLEDEQHFVYEQSQVDEFAVGDLVVATVTIEPEGNARYVTVFEPLPAGFSVVEEDRQFRLAGIPSRYGNDYWGWNYWYDAREIRDQGIDYYFARLTQPVSFTYILRAEHAGEFAALPTQVWLAYEQDIRANSAAQRLVVTPE